MSRGISRAFLVGKVVGDAKVRKDRGTGESIEARAWVNVSRAKYTQGSDEPTWVENLIMVQGLGTFAAKLGRLKDGDRVQVVGGTNLVPYKAMNTDGTPATNVEGHPIERKRLVVVTSGPGHQVVEGGPSAANSLVIVGRVGGDPEVKTFESGGMNTRINVATDRYNPDGEKDERGRPKDDTIWHNVTIKGKRAEAAGQFIKRGDMVIIEGQLETKEWEKDGVQNDMTRVVAFGFEFTGKRGGGDASAASAAQKGWGDDFEDYDNDPTYAPKGAPVGKAPVMPPKGGAPDPYSEFDDEIPF